MVQESKPASAVVEAAQEVLAQRLQVLHDDLAARGAVMVAFSGGADSAFLLAAAVRALGSEQVVAATAQSASLASGELERASAFATDLQVDHLVVQTAEMQREGYAANAGNRCYFCKAELLDVLTPLAAQRQMVVATGTNADDALAGFRPGIAAAAQRGAITPLRDADLTKAQVREASRAWGLLTWDKPAAACLSSRIAYGITITPARLLRVDAAEQAVRQLLAQAGKAVTDLRVRDLGDHARVEVDQVLALQLHTDSLAQSIRAALLELGYPEVTIDPRGFRSGSMNELLPHPVTVHPGQ